jgi:hypothetical protein
MRSPEMALRSTRNTVELNALALGTGNTNVRRCQRAARKGRENGKGQAPRRPPAPVELPLPMASLESAAVGRVGRTVRGRRFACAVCV